MGTSPLRVRTHWIKRLLKRGTNLSLELAKAKQLPPARLQDLLTHASAIRSLRPYICSRIPLPLGSLGKEEVDRPYLIDLDTELNWTVASLSTQATDLNSALDARDSFEAALLSDQHEAAQAIIEAEISTRGWSLWAIDSQLLLTTTASGDRQAQLTRILDEINEPLAEVFSVFADRRMEENVSASNHDREIESLVALLAEDDWLASVQALLSFWSIRDWSEERAAKALHFHNRFALIDRYLFVTRLVQALFVSQGLASFRTTLRRHSRSLMALVPRDDTRRLQLVHSPDRLEVTSEQAKLIAISDRYTVGDYAGAARSAADALNENPGAIEFAELFANAAGYIGATETNLFGTQLSNQIAQDFRRVVGKTHEATGAVARLRSLAYRFASTRMGARLFALTTSHTEQAHPLGSPLYRLLVATAPSARDVESYESAEDAKRYLTALTAAYPKSQSVLLFNSTYPTPPPTTIEMLEGIAPRQRVAKYLAHAMERAGQFDEAIALHQEILSIVPRNSPPWMNSTLSLLRNWSKTGEYQAATISAADCYADDRLAIPNTYLQQIAAHPPVSESSTDALLSHAIIVYALQRLTRATLDAAELYPCVDSVLQSVGKLRPSQLPPETPTQNHKLVLFLNNICVPEVLDWSIEYESSQDLENERIEICRLLQRLDRDKIEQFADEIDRRNRSAAIQRVMRVATLSKVHVDVAGVRKSLGVEFPELFALFQQFTAAADDVKTILGVMVRKAARKSQLLVLEAQMLRTLQRAPLMFERLFERVKDRFLASDEYGLDSYLSVRIRHGTLAGQLRGPFERRQLVTRRRGSADEYTSNERWILAGNELLTAALQVLLARFSTRVDDAIEQAKRDWIQIRNADRPNGMFDFSFSAAELETLASRPEVARSLTDLVDIALDALWSRTRKCLETVRSAVTTTLSTEFMGALDELDQGVRSLEGEIPGDLSAEIAMSRTEIQNELAIVASWFQLQDLGDLPDYEVGAAVDAAISTVQRNLSEAFGPSVVVSPDLVLRGSSLPHMLDIFHIIFENIVRHSGDSGPDAKTSFLRTEERMTIEASNSIPSWAPQEGLGELVKRLEAFASATLPEGVKTEGGSGYRKLGKILRYDLNCTDARVMVDIQDRKFTVSINFSLANLHVAVNS